MQVTLPGFSWAKRITGIVEVGAPTSGWNATGDWIRDNRRNSAQAGGATQINATAGEIIVCGKETGAAWRDYTCAYVVLPNGLLARMASAPPNADELWLPIIAPVVGPLLRLSKHMRCIVAIAKVLGHLASLPPGRFDPNGAVLEVQDGRALLAPGHGPLDGAAWTRSALIALQSELFRREGSRENALSRLDAEAELHRAARDYTAHALDMLCQRLSAELALPVAVITDYVLEATATTPTPTDAAGATPAARAAMQRRLGQFRNAEDAPQAGPVARTRTDNATPAAAAVTPTRRRLRLPGDRTS